MTSLLLDTNVLFRHLRKRTSVGGFLLSGDSITTCPSQS